MNWREVNEAPKWIPILHQAEDHNHIPRDLLARIAFEESSFLPDIISGKERSSAGCVGIMQLNPKYFPSAGIWAATDIYTAGNYLASLHNRFKDWQVALAAYNFGPGNVNKCLSAGGALADMPAETQSYLKQILTDVPLPGSLYG